VLIGRNEFILVDKVYNFKFGVVQAKLHNEVSKHEVLEKAVPSLGRLKEITSVIRSLYRSNTIWTLKINASI
jgi:hypothetical protein